MATILDSEIVVVRNTQNNYPYQYLGGNRFRNMATGVEGDVPEDKAKELLKINMEATAMCNEYPLVAEMIKALNLKFDK